jgi:hypothetical protein
MRAGLGACGGRERFSDRVGRIGGQIARHCHAAAQQYGRRHNPENAPLPHFYAALTTSSGQA